METFLGEYVHFMSLPMKFRCIGYPCEFRVLCQYLYAHRHKRDLAAGLLESSTINWVISTSKRDSVQQPQHVFLHDAFVPEKQQGYHVTSGVSIINKRPLGNLKKLDSSVVRDLVSHRFDPIRVVFLGEIGSKLNRKVPQALSRLTA